jgi:hypothetical protein
MVIDNISSSRLSIVLCLGGQQEPKPSTNAQNVAVELNLENLQKSGNYENN